MARLASLVLLGAALTSAHPGHGHNHAHKHRAVDVEEKRAIGDVISAVIDGVEVSWTQESDYYNPAAPSPAATTAPAVANVNVNLGAATTLSTATKAYAAASTAAASSGSTTSTDTTGYAVSVYTDFSDITCLGSSEKRATLAQINQVGNTGDSCYGSNMLVVTDADVAAQYDNTIRMYGATEDMVCAYWNKASKTGQINGWYKDMDSYFTFDLPAAGTVYLAAENGTAGGASCFPKSTGIQFDNYGAIAGTWLEFTFIDVTYKWSAYDASCIIAENAGLLINGLEVCLESGEMCSSIGLNLATISAAFNAALAAADGIGGNVDGTMHIAANWGFV
ncbi:unnamed protein product [Discula destructiva]